MRHWTVLLGFLTACNVGGSLNPLEKGELPLFFDVQEQFLQRPLPAVDLLFVIDDTLSMADVQGDLAEQFDQFAAELETRKIRWHGGVITMAPEGQEAGWLQGEPWLVTSSLPNASDIFSENLLLGSEGVQNEAGIYAAVKALDYAQPGKPNAGFRRSEAALVVVFVSNEDDGSDEWISEDPVDALLTRLDNEVSDYGTRATVSAIVGDAKEGCDGVGGWVAPGARYLQAVAATGGGFSSICAPDLSVLWEGMNSASGWYLDTFFLTHTPQREEYLRVRVDEEYLEEGWVLEMKPPRIVFSVVPAPDSVVTVEYFVGKQP